MTDRVLSLVISGRDDLSPILGNAGSGLIGVATHASDMGVRIGNALDGVQIAAANTFDSVKLAAGNALDSAATAAGTVGDVIANHLMGAKGFIESSLNDIFSGFGRIAEHQIQLGLEGAFGLDARTSRAIAGTVEEIGALLGAPLQGAITAGLGDLGGRVAEKLASSGLVASAGPILAGAGAALGVLFDTAIAAAPLLLPALLVTALVAAVVLVVNDPSIIGKAIDLGVGLVRGIIGGLAGFAGMLLGALVSAVGNIIKGGADLVAAVVDLGAKFVTNLIHGLISFPIEFVKALVGFIGDVFTAGVGIASAVLDLGVKIVGGIIGGLISFPIEFVKAIVGFVGGLFTAGVGIAQSVLELGGKIVGGIVGGLVDFGKAFVNEIVKQVGGLFTAGVGIAKSVFDLGVSIVGGIIGGLVSLPGKLIDAITGAFRDMLTTGINIGPFHIGLNGVTIDMPTIDVGDFHSGGSKGGKAATVPGAAAGMWDTGAGGLVMTHPNEMILPATEAATYRGGGGSSVNLGGVTINVTGATDPEDIATRTLLAIQRKARQQRINLSFG